MEKQITEEDVVRQSIGMIQSIISCDFLDLSTEEKFKVCIKPYGAMAEDTVIDHIILLAQNIKRHIVILENSKYVPEIKKRCDNNILNKYFLFITTIPSTDMFYYPGTGTKSMLFGRKVTDLCVIKGINVTFEITAIQENTTYSDSYRKEQIDKLITERSNSPYSKYDKIYKDTSTNIVFALQDRFVLHLLFKASSQDEKLLKTVLTEIGRRFDGSISYSELVKIDKDYHSVIEAENMNEYSQFIVDGAASTKKLLEKSYIEAKEMYENTYAQAMEYGKKLSKLMEQIDLLNSSNNDLKIKQKAIEEYNAVKEIPGVSAVYIEGEQVHVFTNNLYARDDRTKKLHDIGTFHITIGMHSTVYDTSKTVIIKNTKHQIAAFNNHQMQAPHVFPEGYVCHGTLATGMANAYKKRDLYQLVYQLVLFLAQANTDDAAGKYIDRWPVADESVLNAKIEESKTSVAGVEIHDQVPVDEFDAIFAAAIPV